MSKAILFALLSLTTFSASALNFENQDGYVNRMQGSDPSGNPCNFSYVVDKGFFLGRETSSVTMSVFSDHHHANPSMILNSDVFQDVFVSGKAFAPAYRLPEFATDFFELKKIGGENSLTYRETHEFRRYTLRVQVDFILGANAKLEEIRVERQEERWGPDFHQSWICRF